LKQDAELQVSNIAVEIKELREELRAIKLLLGLDQTSNCFVNST